MAPSTRAPQQQENAKLKFKEKLIGKQNNADTVIKKLKALHEELANLDQEKVDTHSLSAVRKDLLSTSIFHHKDRGVKAYAACCIAEILRLYAPEAPYTAPELRDIFQFITKQLANGLKGTNSPYYEQYYHLLESLSTVKSIVLVCDLPQAEELMVEIFRVSFGIVRLNFPKKIEIFLTDILSGLLDECQVLPGAVLDSLMAQFLDHTLDTDQPAYRMAIEVCRQTADKLQRYVCQYFTDIIISHSKDPTDEDFQKIESAHSLIRKIHRSVPALLHNVIPQLEEELRVEETQIRVLSTRALGAMFSDRTGTDLARKFPTAWTNWIMRKNDRSSNARVAFIESSHDLITNPEVSEALTAKITDPDEKVRIAVCRLFGQLDYETAFHHVSESQLRALADRAMDRRAHVRNEALTSIGKLYSLAYPEIESKEEAAVKQFGWIAQKVIHALPLSVESKEAAEQTLADYILPLPAKGEDEEVWTDRLLLVVKSSDDEAIKTLLNISGLKTARPTPFEKFIECCVANNGGIIDDKEEEIKARLSAAIKFLAGTFSDPPKAAQDLNAFAKANESRYYKLLRTCMDPQSDLKSLIKASAEFRKRIEQSHSSLLSTMMIFLRRASLWVINASSISTLLARSQSGETKKLSRTILEYVSRHCPILYKSHTSELTKAIATDLPAHPAETCMQAIAALARSDPEAAPRDKRTLDKAIGYTNELNPRLAKFGARLLAFSKNRDALCEDTMHKIAGGLNNASEQLRVSYLAVVAEISKSVPDILEKEEKKTARVIPFLLESVLMVPILPDENAMNEDDLWIPKEDLPPLLHAKLLALKICRNRCLYYASDEEAAKTVAPPVLKMLSTLLKNEGSINAGIEEDPKVAVRTRLEAALCLLSLSTIAMFAKDSNNDFYTLALMTQDPSCDVRQNLQNKLVALLSQRKLDSRFYLALYLNAKDPESEIRDKAMLAVKYAYRRATPGAEIDRYPEHSSDFRTDSRIQHFEKPFMRFIHLLAHHPDYAKTFEGLTEEMACYIDFYLDAIATADNISFLYHIAGKVKTVRDAESEVFNDNLYTLSELAQELIKHRAQIHSWALNSHPGKVQLPSDIFRAPAGPGAVADILKEPKLPEDVLSWLAEKSKPTKAGPKPSANKDKPKAPRKRKALPQTNGHAKKPRKVRKKVEESDDDGEDDGTSGGDEDTTNGDVPKSSDPPDEDVDDDEDEPEDGAAEDLGRGARTRKKARMRKQAKRQARQKPPSSQRSR